MKPAISVDSKSFTAIFLEIGRPMDGLQQWEEAYKRIALEGQPRPSDQCNVPEMPILKTPGKELAEVAAGSRARLLVGCYSHGAKYTVTRFCGGLRRDTP